MISRTSRGSGRDVGERSVAKDRGRAADGSRRGAVGVQTKAGPKPASNRSGAAAGSKGALSRSRASEEAVILALAGNKGGTGKSTIAVYLAIEAQARGLRTLVVDADPLGSALTCAEVAAEHERENQPCTIAMGDNMRQQLPQATAGFDLVIIDCPGATAELATRQIAALSLADFVLLPCGPTTMDIWALAESVKMVQQVQQIRPELEAAIVVNKKRSRTTASKVARRILAEAGLPVLKASLSLRETYSEAAGAGQGVNAYDPGGAAAAEFGLLFDEVIPKLLGRKLGKRVLGNGR